MVCSQLQASLRRAVGGHALLAAAGARLAHSAPASGAVIRSREDEGRHPGAPASLPEVPPRRRPADGAGAQPDLSLASINDPEQWGLSSIPAQQARGEGYGHYWLGSSLSNPKERGVPATLASQGMRAAPPRQAAQREAVFRSSMVEPELPFAFRSSMADPPLRGRS